MPKAGKIRLVVKRALEAEESFDPAIPDPEFSLSLLAALEQIVDETQNGWDVPALFGPVTLRSRTPVGSSSLTGMMLQWEPWPAVTEAWMHAKRPHHIFLSMAAACWPAAQALGVSDVATLLPPGLMALVFVTEAWTLRTPMGDEEAVAASTQAARDHTLHEHPDRVEAKVVTAVDINGVAYYLTKARGQAEIEHVVGMTGTDRAIGGDIINAIEYLLLTLQGRQLPEWGAWWRAERNHPTHGRDPS